MSWIQTHTGRKFYPLEPTVDMINIKDIAHALSLSCRYNGHCSKFYSVAEHSLIMSFLVSKEAQKYALLHDAAEAYICDVPRPIKAILSNYKEIENSIEQVINLKYDIQLTKDIIDEVKRVDTELLVAEKRLLMDKSIDWGWEHTVDEIDIESFGLGNFNTYAIEQKFINRYIELFL